MSRGRLVLVTGGVRSGKSAFAQRLAGKAANAGAGSVGFVATARVWDDEMAARVARHQADRPQTWRTIEEPLHLVHAVEQAFEPSSERRRGALASRPCR